MRDENVIYIRERISGSKTWEVFVKAKGMAAIAAGYSREDAIAAGAAFLWATDVYGPRDYSLSGLRMDPNLPKSFDYPIVEEEPIRVDLTRPQADVSEPSKYEFVDGYYAHNACALGYTPLCSLCEVHLK